MTTVAVVGAGGVGGLIAAKLAGGGHDVRFVARGATLAAIREHGLVVHGPDGDHRARIAKADSDPAKLGVAQIVIVTVKAWQLADLAPRLRPLVGADTAVLPLQNGVEASEPPRRGARRRSRARRRGPHDQLGRAARRDPLDRHRRR